MRAATKEEGLNFDAQLLLTEAVTAKNCLTTHFDDGASRYGHRLRAIAVKSMVASTAAERAQRALQSKTHPSVQAVNYQIGDQ
eukprot:10547187-Prorocentrum_lima.AAC.1